MICADYKIIIDFEWYAGVGMTDQEVLELLRRIDNGYEPSEEERRVLSSIDKINWRYIDELPESIGNLTSLQYLDLSETEVSELPENLCNIQNLQRLDLCETYIRELPKSMCNLTSLQLHNIYKQLIA